MSRTTWTIEILQSGGTFVSDGTIYTPNSDLSLDVTSTQERVQLADGSRGWVTPETRSTPDELQFEWLAVDNTFATQIRDYVVNGDTVRITDDDGITYYGRFLTVKRIWITGVDPNEYDLQATFEIMSGTG